MQQTIKPTGKQFIKGLVFEQKVESFFSVKYKHPPREYKNGFMFTVGLADRTGEIEVNYWGGRNRESIRGVYDSFKEDDVICVSGIVGEFREKLKIDVNENFGSIRKCTPWEYNIEDFVPKTAEDVKKMASELNEIKNSIKEKHLLELLELFFEDSEFSEEFIRAPAAMFIHHAYIGGLLEHTLHVARLCETMHKIYPQLNRDLMLCGAILHDIGKIREFRVTTNIKISEEGMLKGHIILGEGMVSEKIKTVKGFPDNLGIKLCHIILSHHGSGEYGSPKEPQFPEAVAVYYADEYDSKVDQYVKAKEGADTEDFRIYSKRLGELYVK